MREETFDVAIRMKRSARVLLLLVTALSLAGEAFAGQFGKAAYFHAGQVPRRVLGAQFTQSGNMDLVLADWLNNEVVILLGNGNGTFQAPRKFFAPSPLGIATGDFNEDGNLDVAVVETNGTGDGQLAIFLGDGKGNLKFATAYPIGIESVDVAVADFDGDGHLDVAVTDFGFEGAPGDVIVFFGNGKGKLRRVARFKTLHGPAGIAAGDLNGDHRPDLAVTLEGSGSVAVFLNDGTGHFQKPVIYGAGDCCGPVDVKIADLRNNGDQDLVIANDNAGMVVLLNKGDGTFGKPAVYTPFFQNWQPPEACTVADFNLDGKLDVACAPAGNNAYFFYGNGKGQFGSGIEIKNAINHQGGFSIASGDFNNDNAPDLAIPIEEYGKVAILLNTK
jgi:hypothetical protein